MKRRKFLQRTGLFTAATLIPIGTRAWVAKGVAATENSKRLIVVFLRGGIDGLNAVVPYRESAYYELRPTIAIPTPDREGGALDLDGRFGLHPALADLMPLWKERTLAFIHACGSPHPTRSHFDAQDYMESGTPGKKNTRDGWMNRLLTFLPEGTPTRAVNLGGIAPRIFSGPMSVANLPTGRRANRQLRIDDPAIDAAFDRLYDGNDALSLAYQEGEKARRILLAELDSQMKQADRNAASALGFTSDARQLAKLMAGDAKTRVGFIALGGWDTHVNQGNSRGRQARSLQSLGEGLATLVKELGSVYADTSIVVMSEFGRTVRENGNGGTDHGHGNVMWILGGKLRGGIYGEWPGLAESQLDRGRDLAITTDFRSAIGSVLGQQLQVSRPHLSQIFPGYAFKSDLELFDRA